MEFVLEQWGDGSIHLTYEDRLHGQDIDILLHNVGLAMLVKYTEEGEEHIIISDLVHYLRDLATTPPAADATSGVGE